MAIFLSSQIMAQTNIEKVFATQSIVEDAFICSGLQNISEYLGCIESISRAVVISKSSTVSITQKDIQFFDLQLYELKLFDSKWVLLKYQDVYIETWYRIRGYKENDFIHFYNRVLKKYFKNQSEILHVISTWGSVDTMFAAVDFQCLIKSSKTNNIKYDCMISNTYQQRSYLFIVNASKKTENDRKKEQLYTDHYARFSIRPYMGLLPPPARSLPPQKNKKNNRW